MHPIIPGIKLHEYALLFMKYNSYVSLCGQYFLFVVYIARYLVWFDAFLTNIDKSHPGARELLQKGGMAVARSLVPGALSAVDKTMKETFMKFAKSSGKAKIKVLQKK